jgi:hypothetical protein
LIVGFKRERPAHFQIGFRHFAHGIELPAASGMSRGPGGVIVEYRITVRLGSMRIDGYRRSVFLDRRLASGAGERDAQTEESEHQLARNDPEVRKVFHVWREAGSPNHVQQIVN